MADNGSGVHTAVRELAKASGARVIGVDDSRVTEGPNFGYAAHLGAPAAAHLKAWIDRGGVLISPTLHVLLRGSDIYSPIKLNAETNVARLQSAEDRLASGYLWDENRRQLTYKPFAVVRPSGRGFVVTFTQDPTVRAYLDGLNVILMNAIFRGSAHARPTR